MASSIGKQGTEDDETEPTATDDAADLIDEDQIDEVVCAPLSGQAEVDKETTRWCTEWGEGLTAEPVHWPDVSNSCPLPDMLVHMVRDGALRFHIAWGVVGINSAPES